MVILVPGDRLHNHPYGVLGGFLAKALQNDEVVDALC
jgi:hypothetical protein